MPPADRLVLCPECLGDRTVIACRIGRGLAGPVRFERSCGVCGGAGRVGEQQAGWMQRGRALRNARVARGESQMAAARRFGISPRDLNEVEHGRADPGLVEARMEAA